VLVVGEFVVFAGRRYRLRGVDPASVVPRLAYLEDVKNFKLRQVLLDEIEQRPRQTTRPAPDTQVGSGKE
jgi:hypothetical protein